MRIVDSSASVQERTPALIAVASAPQMNRYICTFEPAMTMINQRLAIDSLNFD